jgi:hypothetical protein
MFDPDVLPLIEEANIDRAYNTLILTPRFHYLFGNFELYFESITVSYIYKINCTRSNFIIRNSIFLVIRFFYLSSNRNIDLSFLRFLAIYRVCAAILYLSGVGKYIDRVFKNMDGIVLTENRFSDIKYLILLKAGG